ncbi:HAD family hydrolase [Sphingorhabdus arenilitoris]|uniref:HAD family hydrolase n=1 Tax=Sphingorhabdus arenilitoris TaxID=1490041 RepID=A0ABV8RE97_9SPHN
MQRIAIYDLDRTIVKTPTFTAFLFFAAAHLRRPLWWRVPLWAGALIGYVLKLYGRKALKQYGMKLFIGRELPSAKAQEIAELFAQNIIPSDILPGAAAAIDADRAAGGKLIIASAAQALYVSAIARALQFDAFVATENLRSEHGYAYLMDGENCYGAEKLRRVQLWLDRENLVREDCDIWFYSDHPSDAPMLNWADRGILVGPSPALAQLAAKNGWDHADFSLKPTDSTLG